MRFRRILTATGVVSPVSCCERGKTGWGTHGEPTLGVGVQVRREGPGPTGTADHSARPARVLRTLACGGYRLIGCGARSTFVRGEGGPDPERPVDDVSLARVFHRVEHGSDGRVHSGTREPHPQLGSGQLALDDPTDG